MIIFLPISLNICFECPKEPSHRDTFLSTHKICFGYEIRKIVFGTYSNLEACSLESSIAKLVEWLQSLKQCFKNVSYNILVASLTLMALF